MKPFLHLAQFSLILSFLFGALSSFGCLWCTCKLVELNMALPQIEAMNDFRPSLITTVYGSDGTLIGSFAIENRELVHLEDVPKQFKDAIIAVEDEQFYIHSGVNIKGILRALRTNLQAGRITQGGSTITQQLARVLFLSSERKLVRKVKEALLAIRIEKHFTKSQILEMYLNQIYFGHGAYGIKQAAWKYFGKALVDLSLAECAMLAGLPKAPNNFTPFRHELRAYNRRSVVLDRMVLSGFLDRESAETAKGEEFHLSPLVPERKLAQHFLEMLRQRLEQRYGTATLYRGGLQIYTGINPSWQGVAEEAVRWGALELQKRRKYCEPEKCQDGEESDENVTANDVVGALIKARGKRSIIVEIEGLEYELDLQKEGWSIDPVEPDPFLVGNRILCRVKEEGGGKVSISLYCDPECELALLALEPGTGICRTWVGGVNFERSQFDRVYQAHRQPGSAFKPIIYTAALDTKYTAAHIIYDSPIVKRKVRDDDGGEDDLLDEIPAELDGDKQPVNHFLSDLPFEDAFWRPQNYSQQFYGPTTLRTALAKSRNLVTIKLLQKVGIRSAIRYARLLGITSPLAEDLTLALGSSGVSLVELVTAYSVFPNQGLLTELIPYITIKDRDGYIIAESYPRLTRVLDPQVSFLMTQLLKGVIDNGTGISARSLGRALGGKTGTTNDHNDAWFIGFCPDLITGVWVGMDQLATLGSKETGARSALPIWKRFMKEALKDLPEGEFPPAPAGITLAPIDPKTGLLADEESENVVMESFISGTEPILPSTHHRLESSDFSRVDSEWNDEDVLSEDEGWSRNRYSSD